MSKLANPWKCDASGCGMLRANDTNHWLIIQVSTFLRPWPTVCVSTWSDELAAVEGVKHACGIDCCLKVTAQLIVDNFYPAVNAAEPGKEVQRG